MSTTYTSRGVDGTQGFRGKIRLPICVGAMKGDHFKSNCKRERGHKLAPIQIVSVNI